MSIYMSQLAPSDETESRSILSSNPNHAVILIDSDTSLLEKAKFMRKSCLHASFISIPVMISLIALSFFLGVNSETKVFYAAVHSNRYFSVIPLIAVVFSIILAIACFSNPLGLVKEIVNSPFNICLSAHTLLQVCPWGLLLFFQWDGDGVFELCFLECLNTFNLGLVQYSIYILDHRHIIIPKFWVLGCPVLDCFMIGTFLVTTKSTGFSALKIASTVVPEFLIMLAHLYVLLRFIWLLRERSRTIFQVYNATELFFIAASCLLLILPVTFNAMGRLFFAAYIFESQTGSSPIFLEGVSICIIGYLCRVILAGCWPLATLSRRFFFSETLFQEAKIRTIEHLKNQVDQINIQLIDSWSIDLKVMQPNELIEVVEKYQNNHEELDSSGNISAPNDSDVSLLTLCGHSYCVAVRKLQRAHGVECFLDLEGFYHSVPVAEVIDTFGVPTSSLLSASPQNPSYEKTNVASVIDLVGNLLKA